jgi:hypothetical protein
MYDPHLFRRVRAKSNRSSRFIAAAGCAVPEGRVLKPAEATAIRALLGDRSRDRALLIEYLHLIQEAEGYLPEGRLHALADGKAIAGFGSAKGSNEEAYLFKKLIRQGFGSNNVDHPLLLAEAAAILLTNPQLDPIGKIPEFKFCAAKVERGEMAVAAK